MKNNSNQIQDGCRAEPVSPRRGRRWSAAVVGILVLAWGLVPLSGRSETEIRVGKTPGFPGGIAPVEVLFREVTNLTALQFDLVYDPARVTPTTFLPGEVFSNHVVRAREVAPGHFRVLAYSRFNDSLTITNVTLGVTIPFQVSPLEYVSSGPISPVQAKLARPDASPVLPFSLETGIIFVRAVQLSSGGAEFFLRSQPGARYVIQATTNFVDWTTLSTNTASGDYLDLFDADAGLFPRRFYRAQPEPEP